MHSTGLLIFLAFKSDYKKVKNINKNKETERKCLLRQITNQLKKLAFVKIVCRNSLRPIFSGFNFRGEWTRKIILITKKTFTHFPIFRYPFGSTFFSKEENNYLPTPTYNK